MALGVLLWALHLGLQPLSDNSFLTHLATGRLIVSTGEVPTVDPYSFTAPGADWVVQSWLASAIYGAVGHLAGGAGLVALYGVLYVALAAVVLALTRPADGLLVRLGLCALALAVGTGLWSERPLLFGLILFGLSVLVAEHEHDPRVLVVVFALWVNLHGSFPLGIVLLLCLAGGAALDRAPTEHLRRCFGWALAGVALGAINPLGPRLVLFPVTLLSRSEVLEGVAEWQAPAFQSISERAWLLQLVVAILLLVRRPSYRVAVPLAVFAAASMLALRNIPVASLAILPSMVTSAAGLGSISVRARSVLASGSVFVLAGASVAVVLQAASRPAFELSRYPVAPLALLASELGSGSRVVAPDIVGNYLEAVEGDEAAVFYDDRFDMFPPELAAGHRLLSAGKHGWEGVLDDHGADAVVWQRDRPLSELLVISRRWHIMASDMDWLVAVRR